MEAESTIICHEENCNDAPKNFCQDHNTLVCDEWKTQKHAQWKTENAGNFESIQILYDVRYFNLESIFQILND